MFDTSQTPESDELHQWPVRTSVDVGKPQCPSHKRSDKNSSLEGLPQSQLAGQRDLEEHNPDENAVAHHHPAFPRRMLSMLHRIQQLVLMYEMTNHEICKAAEQHMPGVSQDAVHQAYDEN